MSLTARRLRAKLRKTDYKKMVNHAFLFPNVNYRFFANQPELAAISKDMAGGQLVWLSQQPSEEVNRTVLYFHGGALTTPLSADQVELVTKIAKESDSQMVIADYPLMGAAFSVAMLDFAEQALLEVTQYNQPVVLLADSAGAWMVRYLWQRHPELVASTVLISPWLDWELTSCDVQNLADDDVLLDVVTMQSVGRRFWAGLREDQRKLLAEPLGDVGPVQIIAGANEMLLPNDRQLAAELQQNNAVVSLIEYPAGFHDFVLWFDLPETKKAIKQMAKFIKDQYGV